MTSSAYHVSASPDRSARQVITVAAAQRLVADAIRECAAHYRAKIAASHDREHAFRAVAAAALEQLATANRHARTSRARIDALTDELRRLRANQLGGEAA